MAYARSTLTTNARISALPAMREPGFIAEIERISQARNIPTDWLMMVMALEAGLNPALVRRNSRGEITVAGLMQWTSPALAQIEQVTQRRYTLQGIASMSARQQLEVANNWLITILGIAPRGVQSFWHFYLRTFLPFQHQHWNTNLNFGSSSQGSAECGGTMFNINNMRAFVEFKTCRLRRDYGITAPAPPPFMTAPPPAPVSNAPVDIARVGSLSPTITPLPTLNPVPMPVVAVTPTPLQQRTGFFGWLANIFSPRRTNTLSAFSGINNPNHPQSDRQCFTLLIFCLSALLLFAVLYKVYR